MPPAAAQRLRETGGRKCPCIPTVCQTLCIEISTYCVHIVCICYVRHYSSVCMCLCMFICMHVHVYMYADVPAQGHQRTASAAVPQSLKKEMRVWRDSLVVKNVELLL